MACVTADTNRVDSLRQTLAAFSDFARPPYPCPSLMRGAGKYGLQCLTNLDQLPPTGALVVAAPLKIENGSGSPLRVLALVDAMS